MYKDNVANTNTNTNTNTNRRDSVLVVVPCLDEAACIEATMRFIIDEIDPLDALLVVVDGGSTDGTRDIIQQLSRQFPNTVLLENPKKIQSAAVNLAVLEYGDRYNFLVRMDVHSQYPTGYITALIRDAHEHQADSVVVSMDTRGKNGFQKLVALAQNSLLGNGGSGHRKLTGKGRWIDHGHHALITMAAFKSVGGYDENFTHNEDAEFDYRLGQVGCKIWLTAETQLVYFPRNKISSLFRQYRNYGRGRARNVLKHKQNLKFRQWLPVFVFPLFLLGLLGLLSQLALLPFLLWALANLLFGIKIGLGASADNGHLRFLTGFPAAVMQFAWSLGFCEYMTRSIFSNSDHWALM